MRRAPKSSPQKLARQARYRARHRDRLNAYQATYRRSHDPQVKVGRRRWHQARKALAVELGACAICLRAPQTDTTLTCAGCKADHDFRNAVLWVRRRLRATRAGSL